ncbi:MAG: efflux RND transporter periplasmic adaptor subunit [Phycisphaerales bacterium]|nr:MAG: efflux RND transporter periplasmic adaptor subunit [Phycisphaerales bacterium]
MRNRFIHATVSLVVFVGLSLLLVFLTSSNWSQASPAGAEAETHGHEHGEVASDHGAGGEEPDGHEDHEGDHQHEHAAHEALSLDELSKLQCEHDCATIECDECRYELGVAKLNPALAEGLVRAHRVQVEQRVRNALQLTGEIQLDLTRVVEISSAGSGRVETIQRLLGDTVQASDTLAVIQSAEFGQAQADFLEAQAKLDLARQTYEREKTLVDRQVSSQADFLTARKEFVATQVAVAAARKRLQLFGLSDGQIEVLATTDPDDKFGQLVLTTPIAGTILEQNIVRGQLVSPAQRLYRVADLSSVWVLCDLYESDLAALYDRMSSTDKVEAQLRVAAFPGETFKATVDLLGNQLDRDTRTLRVRLVADNVQGKLKPGMFVTAFIPLVECEPVVHVPESAVLTDEGEHFVFARLTDELWIRRDIAVGHRDKGLVEVLAGLTEGETIATQGAFMFKSEVLKEKMGAGCAH